MRHHTPPMQNAAGSRCKFKLALESISCPDSADSMNSDDSRSRRRRYCIGCLPRCQIPSQQRSQRYTQNEARRERLQESSYVAGNLIAEKDKIAKHGGHLQSKRNESPTGTHSHSQPHYTQTRYVCGRARRRTPLPKRMIKLHDTPNGFSNRAFALARLFRYT